MKSTHAPQADCNATADVRVIDAAPRSLLGEGPLWSPRDNALYWVDILGHRVHRFKLHDESVQTWDMPEKIGWLIERSGGPGFVAGFQSGFALLSLEPQSIQPLARPEAHLPNNRMNDAKADAAGRIWAGTMDCDADKPSGSHYRLDPDHTVTQVDSGYYIANGPAFSPDHRFMYHTDSKLGHVYRFDVADDGQLGSRRLFLEFDTNTGAPDGMTVDEEGGLWIAEWGASRITRFSPEGVRERSITFPASQITSCAFAGHNLDRLFVTSAADGRSNEPFAGALFEVDPGVCGLAPGRFAG